MAPPAGGITGDIDAGFHHKPGLDQRDVQLLPAAPSGGERPALDALERGEVPSRPDQTDPLVLRLRAVIVQVNAHRDDTRRWAAEKMAHGIWGAPYRSVYESAGIRSRLTADWRADLHADLGRLSLPPIPDEQFWGTLRNPAIDSSWYAAQYAQDQD